VIHVPARLRLMVTLAALDHYTTVLRQLLDSAGQR
jgi:hypothetical protein